MQPLNFDEPLGSQNFEKDKLKKDNSEVGSLEIKSLEVERLEAEKLETERLEQKQYRYLFNKAIEMLSRREYSEKMLREKLLALNVEDLSQIDRVIDKIQGYGYQNDQRFTELFIRNSIAKGLGFIRIRQELKQKGIDAELADRGIEDASGEGFSQDELIYRVWLKKFKALPVDPKEKAKQYRFLMYRGFSSSEIAHFYDWVKNSL